MNEEQKEICDSGAYRPGYTIVRGRFESGKYLIKVSSFYPNKLGSYFIDYHTTSKPIFL